MTELVKGLIQGPNARWVYGANVFDGHLEIRMNLHLLHVCGGGCVNVYPLQDRKLEIQTEPLLLIVQNEGKGPSALRDTVNTESQLLTRGKSQRDLIQHWES